MRPRQVVFPATAHGLRKGGAPRLHSSRDMARSVPGFKVGVAVTVLVVEFRFGKMLRRRCCNIVQVCHRRECVFCPS